MTVRTDILPEELTKDQQIQFDQVFSTFQQIAIENSRSGQWPGERMRQPRAAIDIDTIPVYIKQVLDDKQKLDGVADNLLVRFHEETPRSGIETEEITYSLVQREPGTLSKGPHMNRGVQEWKQHIRGIEEDPERPGQQVVIMGQKFDNELMLTCWARTNKAANARARWLEDTLREYAWYIKFNGVDEFYFMGQGSDIVLELDGKDNIVVGRPLRYFVRTERITLLREQQIRRLIIQYGIGH